MVSNLVVCKILHSEPVNIMLVITAIALPNCWNWGRYLDVAGSSLSSRRVAVWAEGPGVGHCVTPCR